KASRKSAFSPVAVEMISLDFESLMTVRHCPASFNAWAPELRSIAAGVEPRRKSVCPMEAPGRLYCRFRNGASKATSHLLAHAIRQASPQLKDIVRAFFYRSDERVVPPIPQDRRLRACPNLRLRLPGRSTIASVLRRQSPRAIRQA